MATTVVSRTKMLRNLRELQALAKKLSKVVNFKAMPPYWLALGRFVHFFSIAEMQVTFVMRHLMKTDERVARIVTGGAQLDSRATYIKELMVVRRIGRKTRDEMKYILDQLSIIAKVRNDILHYGTGRFMFRELIISNAVVAKTSSRVREYAIDVSTLEKMTADLQFIIQGLGNVLYDGSVRVSKRRQWEKYHGGAWRYKSLPPIPPRRKSLIPVPTQLLRPRSSRRRSRSRVERP